MTTAIAVLLTLPRDIAPEPPAEVDSGVFATDQTYAIIVLAVLVIAGVGLYLARRNKR